MSDESNKTVKDSGPAPISSTTPGAGEDLLRAGIMQQPDQPGMLGKIGRFDVIKLIGQGGMGQVLLAREPVTNVKVAIKVLKPEFARDAASVHRFLTEARHAYAMGHPNILKVMEVSDSDDRPFYVVPYIEGGSLARRLGPQKPLSTSTTLDVARQIAGALSYAHGRGIIHRDLKPANVLVDGEGRAYLTDFGLLRTVFNDSFLDVQQSSLEGTAPYMSPAVVQGKAEDTRCDIYSFGAMLYEMLTGQPPYTAPSIEIILKKIAAGPPEPLLKINPKASKELAAIADWAMARELRDRYATMADVLSDLERVAKGKEPLGPRGVVGLGRPMRRNLAIAGAALAVVALAAFVLSKMTPSSKTGTASVAGQKIDLTSGLVAHFPLDGHVRDATGNGHDGKIHGNVRYTNGPIGQGIDLDGSAWVTLPDEKFLDGSSNATVALWFFSRAGSEWRTAICGAEGGSAPSICVQFDCGTCGFWNCGFGDAIGAASIKQSANSPRNIFQNSKWHFFAMTLDAETNLTTLRVYLDGELKEATTINRPVPIRYDRPMATLIGSVAGYHNWIGSLDDVRIYNRMLSPAEIQKLYANASPAAPPAAPAVAPAPPASPVPGQPGLSPRATRVAPRLPGQPPATPAAIPVLAQPEAKTYRRLRPDQSKNLLTNGSFELGSFLPDERGEHVLLPGSSNLVGWTVIENHVCRHVDNTGRGSGDTNNYFSLSLKGYSAEPPFGGITQTIPTESGKAYQLSLDLLVWNSPGERSLPGVNSVLVRSGSAETSFTNSTSEKGIGVWKTLSFVFVAQSTRTPITILGQSAKYVLTVDNVSVEPLPDSEKQSHLKPEPTNLLANADFEVEGEPGKPAQWTPFDWRQGKTDIKFEWSNEAHGGKRSLAISSKEGGDGLWYQTVKVEPYQNYRFSGWVKTQNIVSKGGHGVWFDVGRPGVTPLHFARELVREPQDWQRFETVFNTLGWSSHQMICYFGGAGTIIGKAFFDDLSIVPMQKFPRIEGQIVNGSFEEEDGGWPLGWSVRADWAPKFEHAKTGRTGSRSVKISAQPHRNGLWIFIAKVKRNTSYKLAGWIRTENLSGGARANLDVGVDGSFAPENKHISTEGLGETRDWTPASLTFPSGQNDWIQIACQLTAGGGTAAGHAWFDDITLEEVPTPPAPAPQPSRLPTRPGVVPAVPAPAAPPRADWRSLLQQADAAYAENRFDEAIKFYDAALAGLEQDQTTDATILKTMKAAALKHRGLASFIPQRDKLPADKQVEALHTKLRELNPNYNGKGRFTVRDGKIVEAWLASMEVPDLSPLKGLPLSSLVCNANRIQDLSPLRGMPLRDLSCSWNEIADLSPLKGMRLTSLELEHESGGVTDLSPLKGMPLKWLKAIGNVIKDLTPLQGMPLEYLNVSVRRGVIEDLSPLQGMPLRELGIGGNRVSDLRPIRQCPLNDLYIHGNPIRDLSSLKGLRLKNFTCPDDVSDLSPLAGMPIVMLALDTPKVTDLTVVKDLPLLQKLFFKADLIKTGWEAIRQHPTLQLIEPTAGAWEAARPAAEFWKRFDAGEFTNAAPR